MALLNPSRRLIAVVMAGGLLLGCEPSAPSGTPMPSGTAAQKPAPTPVAPGTEGARGAGPAPPASTPAGAVDAGAPTEITAQHVLVTWAGAKRAPKTIRRTKIEARKRAEEALGKARGGTDFSEVVKEYSDDEVTVPRQGNLGKFARDGMVKPFADAAFALAVFGISDVVETEFGYHIIKRNQ